MTTQGQLKSQKIGVSTIYSNTELTLIHVTEDKLRLALIEHLDRVEKRKNWHTPLGILLAILLTFLTTDFRHFGFSKEVWNAFFILCLIVSTVWLAIALRQWAASTSIDTLVDIIKNSSKQSP